MNNKKIKENYLNDICPAFELFDIVKKVALSLIKLKDFHSDIEKCNLYTIDMENGKVNKLHFHCGKGIYICINKLLFHVENENICQLHFSTKEFVNKWIKLCEEKTIEEYENNEFIPALAEHINDQIMSELQKYTDEELRNELKRRNSLKKIARENRAQCKNCIYCNIDRKRPTLSNRYICTEHIFGKIRKHYKVVRNKKGCDKFEKRNCEMLNASYYVFE